MSPSHDAANSIWETMLKVAILGTDRQALKLPAGVDGALLTELCGQVDTAEKEEYLLSAAALLSLYFRAGQLPDIATTTTVNLSPDDDLPRCSAAASARLIALMQKPGSPLLQEWLQAAILAGVRAPEEALPDLLDIGRQQSDLRPSILAVAGKRGHWLAGQNAAWNYAVVVDAVDDAAAEELWQTGTKAERVSVLQQVRRRDAARGREMLKATWSQEVPAERADLLSAFRAGLSLDDEEFLETALDDKRKETRQLAVELLASLPGSQLIERVFERLKPVLRYTASSGLKAFLKSGATLEIVLPEEFEKSMARDGIDEKAQPFTKLGQKAGWVLQMLALVPPTRWEREWDATPGDIIRATTMGEWKEMLLLGWSQAAARHRDITWLERLVESGSDVQFGYGDVLASLAPRVLERLILRSLETTLKSPNQSAQQPFMALIYHHRSQWSQEFVQSILKSIANELRSAPVATHWLRYTLKEWALRIPPRLYDEVSRMWPTDSPHWEGWQPVVEEFLVILQYRNDMLRELGVEDANRQ